jgi:hypothetical protein
LAVRTNQLATGNCESAKLATIDKLSDDFHSLSLHQCRCRHG